MGEGDRYRGFAVTTGSAGTIAAGDYLKQRFPGSVIAGGEAIQCPTMLLNGFGEHRIEGYRRQAHPLGPQRQEHRLRHRAG